MGVVTARDVFKFSEMSNNILEMVQDRDIAIWKTNRKSYMGYRMV